MMRGTGKVTAVASAVLLGVAGSAAGAQAAPSPSASEGGHASVQAWSDCPAGYSCYFTANEGGNPVWLAPSPGCFDLGQQSPAYNDRISSVWNRGGSTVNMYNWNGAWEFVDSVPVGKRISYGGSDWRNDIIDLVCID
jgi:hypothetical protein